MVHVPLVVRVGSLPDLDPGRRVRLAVGEPDLIERQVRCEWRETLEPKAQSLP